LVAAPRSQSTVIPWGLVFQKIVKAFGRDGLLLRFMG